MMLKRVLRGLLVEIGALLLLAAGILFVRIAGADAASASTGVALMCAVAWSALTVWAILISFDLVGA